MRVFKLPETIEKKPFLYRLVERTEKVAIYEQFLGNVPKCFEVFKIKLNKKQPDRYEKWGNTPEWAKDHDWKERFPSDEDFGKSAWTYKTLEKAKEKLKELDSV